MIPEGLHLPLAPLSCLPEGFHTLPSKDLLGEACGIRWGQVGIFLLLLLLFSLLFFLLLHQQATETRWCSTPRNIKATQGSQFPLKAQAGIISHMETKSRAGQDLGETPCTPPQHHQQQRGKDLKVTAPIRDGAAIPSSLP